MTGDSSPTEFAMGESSREVTLPGSGSILGRYRVLRRLGSGGMGQVFSAECEQPTALGHRVALKQIAISDPTLLVRFKHEFRSLADVVHPNLVRLGELVVLSSGLAFYTMELVEGQSMIRWIRRGTPAGTAPNLPRLCHALRQLATGVAHLHRAGRVHRDLKPSNVMISHEGRVVILDFGLVLDLGDHDARITATGQLVGTPAYMAPEQGTRESVSPAVDLYAIGVTLFEALTGCMPFVGSAIRVLLNKQHEPAPDPRELAEGIPDWIAQLCRALLDLAPAQRPSAERIVAILDEHAPAGARGELPDEGSNLRLVGREAELEQLATAYERVGNEGVAMLVTIDGPPGRGKTALVGHFLDAIRRSDSVVLRGRCHPRESVPFKGLDSIVDALAVFLRSLPEVEAAQLRPRHLRELGELFPVLAGIWSEPGRRQPERDPVARRRLGIAALRELLTRLGDEATLVVAIDDFHWADLDGFTVLGELLLPPDPPALLLILSCDRRLGGPIVGGFDELHGVIRHDIELGPLTAAETEQLAAALIDARLAKQPELAVKQWARDSHGEPLALIRAATTSLAQDGAQLSDEELLRRILALERRALELLELAAIVHERLSNELAREVLGHDPDDFATAARELVAAGLLNPVALERGGVIRLSDPRISVLIQVESDDGRRAGLHVALAELLAAHEGEAELIAAHYEAGGQLDDAREYFTRAAAHAAQALAFVRAEQLYRRALRLLERSSTPGLEQEAVELRLALAEQLSNLARGPEAAALYVAVADQSSPERASVLRLRAAQQYAYSGWPQRALPLLGGLLRDIGERLPSSKLDALWTWLVHRLRSTRRRPLRLRAPDEIDDGERWRFDILHTALIATSHRDLVIGYAMVPRVTSLAHELGEASRFVLVAGMDIMYDVMRGHYERARANLVELEQVAAHIDDPLTWVPLHTVWHFYHARLTQLAEAQARFDAAMCCFEQLPGRSWFNAPIFHTHAILLRQVGAYDQLRKSLPAWVSLTHDFGQNQHEALVLSEEVMVRAQLGECEAARRCLERARNSWQVEFYSFTEYLLGIAEVCLLLAEGCSEQATKLADDSAHTLERHGYARFVLPRTRVGETRAWAHLLHAISQRDAKLAPSRRQLARIRRAGIPQYAMTALVFEAGRASLRGRHQRAEQLWREALAECEALSMHGYAAALRMRVAAASGETSEAEQLRTQAQVYFVAEQIADTERFVALMAPANLQLAGPD